MNKEIYLSGFFWFWFCFATRFAVTPMSFSTDVFPCPSINPCRAPKLTIGILLMQIMLIPNTWYEICLKIVLGYNCSNTMKKRKIVKYLRVCTCIIHDPIKLERKPTNSISSWASIRFCPFTMFIVLFYIIAKCCSQRWYFRNCYKYKNLLRIP